MGEDTTDELMRATYCALCKHGFADLTMQDIADESSKSKATLHYHYDSKRDLLVAFLDYLYERFKERVAASGGETPSEQLLAFVDAVMTPPPRDRQEEFQTAILEIKAQAPYEDDFRERLARFDELVYDRVLTIVAAGVEDGTFSADVDPGMVASFFVTVVSGAHTRHVVEGRQPEGTVEALAEYVESKLLADDAEGKGLSAE